MKSKIILSTMLILACTFSIRVNAQLEVQTSGNVELTQNLTVKNDATIKKKLRVIKQMAIGDSLPNDRICLNIEKTTSGGTDTSYGIKTNIKTWASMPTSSIFGLYATANSAASHNMIAGNQVVGVYGFAVKHYNTPSIFSAGVAGVAYYYGGIGVYGAVGAGNLPTSTSGGLYAGYFNGTVSINGTLYSTATAQLGDLQSYESVQTLSSKAADVIQSLNPVSYTLKPDSAWMCDKEATELQNGIHYGLIAQDVQKVLPELVYKRGDKLSINYIELIPLLIMKVQELSAKVEKQEQQIKELQSNR